MELEKHISDLLKVSAIHLEKATLLSNTTRDATVNVWQDSQKRVIWLEKALEISTNYSHRQDTSYWNQTENFEQFSMADTQRRLKTIEPFLSQNLKFLDIGCGMGFVFKEIFKQGENVSLLEPQVGARNYLRREFGKDVPLYESVNQLPDEIFDLITLFHVFEHFTSPLETLEKIKKCCKAGARIIVEVPSAQDALIEIYHCNHFLKHTLWSEHLVLHTPDSLKKLFTFVGFDFIKTEYVQRYPLTNHLYWLAKGLPNGQNIWNQMNTAELNSHYENVLSSMQATDTIIGHFVLK
jgi:2-polyprenyl-3-methyl-5-hydroxy-6-metoxy-1,4-benzoquinol methylase